MISARGKPLLAVAILIALSVTAPAIWWLAGGVMLIATNSSSRAIGHLKVAHDEGVAQFGELPAFYGTRVLPNDSLRRDR